MRTIDFAPLYRSTVGFDRLFDMLDSSGRPDWPPYDIERLGENDYRISMAVAGFAPSEIEVTQQGTDLLVIGKKAEAAQKSDAAPQYLHRGIATRDFRLTFSLADHVTVAGAKLADGLLSIDMVREVAEQLRPRRIEIGLPATAAAASQDSQPKQIEQEARRVRAA